MCVSLLSNDKNVKLLLEKKSNQGWNAAHFAAASGNKDILELLEIRIWTSILKQIMG